MNAKRIINIHHEREAVRQMNTEARKNKKDACICVLLFQNIFEWLVNISHKQKIQNCSTPK